MTAILAIIAQASGSSIEVGWVGGGAVGLGSIVTAVIVLWKRSEAINQALIEAHRLRADEAEARTREITEVLATETSTRKAFADAMLAVAASNEAVAKALERLADTENRRIA